MHEAGVRAGDGGMVALLGSRRRRARRTRSRTPTSWRWPTTTRPSRWCCRARGRALPAAVEHAKELGLRAMELDVTGAFHSPMMASAVPEFAAALARTEFSRAARAR